ncbi:hypothetical protein [Candidatus Palauibacter sp.]|uniref:hypothetical protein n=1 Tax=Candidatus Palauibacter sp. TaxID=3101350 RepID=UPI003B5AF8DD
MTDGDKAAHEARLREQILAPGAPIEGGSPEEVLESMLSAPYPSHFPTFFGLHVDPEGNLWAGPGPYGGPYDTGDEEGPSSMTEFFVFGGDGRHLGVVEMHRNLRVFQIGAEFILGAVRDELGVDYVHMYRIEK